MLDPDRKYARVERERRFLLATLPDFVDAASHDRFEDLFVAGTHVRVRTIHRADGTFVVTKLGQKIVDPDAPDDPRRRLITTIYLSEAESAPFRTLPGIRGIKRRHRVHLPTGKWAFDVWESPASAAGVVLAEIEMPSDEALDALPVPTWAIRDVTDEPRYRSFSLASSG